MEGRAFIIYVAGGDWVDLEVGAKTVNAKTGKVKQHRRAVKAKLSWSKCFAGTLPKINKHMKLLLIFKYKKK